MPVGSAGGGHVVMIEELSRATENRCHILIVEDNPDGRESLRLLLTLLGYDVEVASDGREGLQKALADHFDVAIVDLGLPKLDGYEVARRIRRSLGQHIRLVAYTAYDPDDAADQVRDAGFDAHLVKPASLQDLIPWLHQSISRN
jgi:CheY-like chemotaxis protein